MSENVSGFWQVASSYQGEVNGTSHWLLATNRLQNMAVDSVKIRHYNIRSILLKIRQLRMAILLYPESKMALGEITDGNYKQNGKYLADQRVPVKYFHQ